MSNLQFVSIFEIFGFNIKLKNRFKKMLKHFANIKNLSTFASDNGRIFFVSIC